MGNKSTKANESNHHRRNTVGPTNSRHGQPSRKFSLPNTDSEQTITPGHSEIPIFTNLAEKNSLTSKQKSDQQTDSSSLRKSFRSSIIKRYRKKGVSAGKTEDIVYQAKRSQPLIHTNSNCTDNSNSNVVHDIDTIVSKSTIAIQKPEILNDKELGNQHKSIENVQHSTNIKESNSKIHQKFLGHLGTIKKRSNETSSIPSQQQAREQPDKQSTSSMVKGVLVSQDYLSPKDALQEHHRSASQAGLSVAVEEVPGASFSSLPNSLSKGKGRNTNIVNPIRKEVIPLQTSSELRLQNMPKQSPLHSSFPHFEQIQREGARPKLGVATSKTSVVDLISIKSSQLTSNQPFNYPHGIRQTRDHGQLQGRRSSNHQRSDPITVRHDPNPSRSDLAQVGHDAVVPARPIQIPERYAATYQSSSVHSSPQSNDGWTEAGSDDVGRNKQYFVAVKEWKANDREDLDVKLHEKLELLNVSSDSWWYMRSCVTGSRGTLPSNILVPFNAIEGQEWFFDGIARRGAEEQLKAAGRHGTFLIRPSESNSTEYSLSILDGDTVKHYRIRERDTGGYFIAFAKHFATLQELVIYYSTDVAGLCARLAIPCAKVVGRGSNHEVPKDLWEIDRASLAIGKVLGKGHFGIVREGTFQGNIKVAIKELRQAGKGDLREFQTEVNALKNLKHERLLSLFGVCSDREPYYIVTEYLKYGSLLEYFKGSDRESFQLDELLHIALQVAEGMTYLESQQYIHRDLAARNVLLDDCLNSKIADFGMSKLVKDCYYTSSDNVRVPIKWTALEALTHGTFSSKSDVWSYGILLYEIITTGVTPYKDLDNSEVIQYLEKGNRIRQESFMEDTCYNIMLECWAKKPENRPTFNELQVKLTSYIGSVKTRIAENNPVLEWT